MGFPVPRTHAYISAYNSLTALSLLLLFLTLTSEQFFFYSEEGLGVLGQFLMYLCCWQLLEQLPYFC